MRDGCRRLGSFMQFEISEQAVEAIRAKGGTAAIDYINPIG